VERANQPTVIKTLGKVLDRQGKLDLDVAGHIDHEKAFVPPPAPAATVEYGSYLANMCKGCHGQHLSGGPIPGAPPSLPTPLNLTPDETGLKGWAYADFETLMRKGVRKNGQTLNPFMPIESWGNLDDTELHGLFAYLQSIPPAPFGNR
jgi:mono/diheme cytochrome c family protein